MKKIMRMTMFLLVATFFGVTFASAESGIMKRAKRDVNPLTGGSAMTIVGILGFDEKQPYVLRFVLEFEKQIKGNASWAQMNGAGKSSKAGIRVRNMDEYGYVKLVTLDMKKVKKMTGSLATPIVFYLGSNSPISGYPNYEKVVIRERGNVPDVDRDKYLESTPLEIVLFSWDDEKQTETEYRVVHTNTLR